MSVSDKLFPSELLEKSKHERRNYFDNTTVSHQLLDDALKAVVKKVNEPASGNLLIVIGPTGVGKSTLLKLTHKSILSESHPPNTIPSIRQELVAPDRGSFNFKDFYIRSLQDLQEPLIDKKAVIPDLFTLDTNDRGAARYRRSLENALHYRQTRAFLIDEAQHFGSVTTGRGFVLQTDSLKSLANMSNTLLVLFGHYDLLSLRAESGQLIRRAPYIHFRRYDIRKENDRTHFKEALLGLERRLPVERQESLIEHWKFFYERSTGCIGVLKDWFKLALWDSLCEDRKSVSIKTFRKYCLNTEDCKKLATEINTGEKSIRELESQGKEKETELWSLYGIDKGKVPQEDSNKNSNRNKPGTQNPKRTPSGRGLRDDK